MKGKVFTAQEVQAILNGSKVMFREVIKTDKIDFLKLNSRCSAMSFSDCPYQVGQKIFAKEKFFNWKDAFRKAEEALSSFPLGPCTIYKNQHYRDIIYNADNQDKENNYKWKPAQHMKQEHSRLTPLIKEIKVERLADITLGDVIKEGIQFVNGWDSPDVIFDKFQELWNATHKKPEEKFEANPFCWVVSFEVVK